MSTKLNFGRDVQGYNAYAPMPATDLFSVTMASAGTASFTVPSSSLNWIVNFSFQPGSDIWVAYGASANVPSGSSFASVNSELLPAQRLLAGGTVVHMINNGASSSDVGVACYAIPE